MPFMSRRSLCVIVILAELNFRSLQPKDSLILVEIILCPHRVKVQGAHRSLTNLEAVAHPSQGLLANLVRVDAVQATLNFLHNIVPYETTGIKLIVLNEKTDSMNEYSVVSFPNQSIDLERPLETKSNPECSINTLLQSKDSNDVQYGHMYITNVSRHLRQIRSCYQKVPFQLLIQILAW